MMAKERVLKAYPGAKAIHDGKRRWWRVYSGQGRLTPTWELTPNEAWRSAAESLKGRG